MVKVKFRSADYGIIEHDNGQYEVIEHKTICDTEEEALEKADKLYRENL